MTRTGRALIIGPIVVLALWGGAAAAAPAEPTPGVEDPIAARQSRWGAPIWPPKPPSARKRPGQPGALLDRLATAPRPPGYFSLEKLATFSRRRKSRRS